MDMVADDIDILAALGVDAVSVGAAGAVADADVQNVHILRVGRVDGPRVAVADLHTVQHHVFGKDGNKCLQLCRLLDRAAENKIKSHL